MTRKCDVCGDDLPTPNLVEVGDGSVCPGCHGALFVDGSTDTAETESTDDRSPALEAFADAVEFFHEQLDRPIDDHQSGERAARPNTGREYFERVRGWDTETVNAKRLGYAPADETALLDYLMGEGYDRGAILGTGLFTEDFTPLWQGRYVFPYFDADDRPVYAISRSTGNEGGGAVGYDGHSADFMSGKYAKPAHTKEYVAVDEPIYGLETVDPGEPVLVTEGIADAITAHECGYACISPVTTQFKHRDRERLVDILEVRDVDRVYVVQDAERPTSDVDEAGRLTLEQFGPGVKGAVATADYLADHDLDARVAELPRPGLDKVDLDDYLGTWSRNLSPVLSSAKPAADHPAHNPQETVVQTAMKSRGTVASAGCSSALFDLDITTVTGLSWGYRGPNPLGHHGQSENYFVLAESAGVAYDHKYKVTYNALTYLLCEAGVRSPSSPNGTLDEDELFAAWRHAKRHGLIPKDDPIPHDALRYVAIENGYCSTADVEDGWRLPREAYNDALAATEDKYGVDPGRSHLSDGCRGRQFPIVECEPPAHDRGTFDVDAHRESLRERTCEWFDEGGLRVFGDGAGTGKTTNAGIAAAADEEPHAVLFEMHEKAREYVTDKPTPDGYFHLKGAEQNRDAVCMDADHADGECPQHGHGSACPSMCPVYDLPSDDEFRELFDRLVEEVGPVEAHLLLDPHDDEQCAFLEQFDAARTADRIVGVQQYLRLSTVTDGRRVIVDEKPSSLRSQRDLSVRQLTRAANELADQSGRTAETRTLTDFASFTRDVVDVLLGTADAPDSLADLEPPTVAWDAYESYDDAAGHYVEYVEPEEDWHLAEALARAKVRYNEAILGRVLKDEWDGTPLCFDALLAVAVEAGLDREQVGKAIAAPQTLRECPRCGSSVEYDNGRGVCPECGWDEAANTITTADMEAARAQVWTDLATDENPSLVYDHLPLAGELPDNALVLDATPTPKRVDALFNTTDTAGDVRLEGEAALELNANITQVLDGQYHYRTIKESDRLRERIQTLIDTAGAIYDRPLIALKRGLKRVFTFPENAEVLHYHAVRGLNRGECDAVFCIGAPHPDVDDLEREAELLAMHRDDVRVGGEEYSTRRDAQGELAEKPPIYRKLNYQDEAGNGRAVPTKAFSGLVGELFRETREKELVQTVHRARPLLADETKDVYLVTNVPTTLPVDDVATLDELAEPLRSFLPVPEGAVRLLEYVRDAEAGNAPDGFRARSLVERDDDGDVAFNRRGFHRLAQLYGEDVTYRTICNWVDALDDLGLVEPGDYESRAGVRFAVDVATLKSALSVVTTNAAFEVAAVRRFRTLAAGASGSLQWLRWARDALGLTGEVDAKDPPPSRGGTHG